MLTTINCELLESCPGADEMLTLSDIAKCLDRKVGTVVGWLDKDLVPTVDGKLSPRQVATWVRQRRAQMEAATVPLDSRHVYFLEAVGSGYIKIGISRAGGLRIRELQTGCPFPLELLAEMPGGYTVEQGLHARFKHLRFNGEWFRDDPELRAVIADAAAVNHAEMQEMIATL